MSPTRQRFRTLDSLRGIAALVVAVYHTNLVFGGYLAVDFFLILSGFVLAHSYLYRERPGGQTIGVRNFIGRRFSRLWPLHAVTMFSTWGLYYLLKDAWGPKENVGWTSGLQSFFLVHNVGFPPFTWKWNFPSWSISVEFWVNVLFILFIRKQSKSWILALVSGACLALIAWQTGSLKTDTDNYFRVLNSGMLRGVCSFLLGILSYRMYLAWRERDLRANLATPLEALFLAASVFLAMAFTRGYPAWELAAPLVFLFMVPLFALERGLISRLLRPFEYLGTISYSVYLNHLSMIILINDPRIKDSAPFTRWIEWTGWQANWAVVPPILLATIGLSVLTYHLIELPCQRGLRRLMAGKTKSQGATPWA